MVPLSEINSAVFSNLFKMYTYLRIIKWLYIIVFYTIFKYFDSCWVGKCLTASSTRKKKITTLTWSVWNSRPDRDAATPEVGSVVYSPLTEQALWVCSCTPESLSSSSRLFKWWTAIAYFHSSSGNEKPTRTDNKNSLCECGQGLHV